MPSRTDTAGHTKAFAWLPSPGALGGKLKCSVPRVGLEPTTHPFRVHACNGANPLGQPGPNWDNII